MEKKIRVLIGKVGLDGHYRGAVVLSHFLRDAGFEVIYTGLYQTPEKIVQTAIQEDVDVVGLSFLSGEHLYYAPRVVKLLKESKAGDKVVIVGGVIPRGDIATLKKAGVSEVFPADTPIPEIIEYIRDVVKGRQSRC